MARGTPVPHKIYETTIVQRAWVGLGNTSATIAPEDAATMVATIGRSHAAVTVESSVLWSHMLFSISDSDPKCETNRRGTHRINGR